MNAALAVEAARRGNQEKQPGEATRRGSQECEAAVAAKEREAAVAVSWKGDARCGGYTRPYKIAARASAENVFPCK